MSVSLHFKELNATVQRSTFRTAQQWTTDWPRSWKRRIGRWQRRLTWRRSCERRRHWCWPTMCSWRRARLDTCTWKTGTKNAYSTHTDTYVIIRIIIIPYLHALSLPAGGAAELAGSRKEAKYSCLPQSLLFQPIALDTLGQLDPSALHFLDELGQWLSATTGDVHKQLSCFRDCLLLSNVTTQFLSTSPLVISTFSQTSIHSSHLFVTFVFSPSTIYNLGQKKIIMWFIKRQCAEGFQWRWRTVAIVRNKSLRLNFISANELLWTTRATKVSRHTGVLKIKLLVLF